MQQLVPKLRFPDFNEGWKLTQIKDLLEFKNGINAGKESYGFGRKFINVLDILNNNFITYERIVGSVNVEDSVAEKYYVEYGDILFQRSSETREEVGTANVYLDNEKPALFGGFVIRGKKIGEYVPVFFNYLLKTDIARDGITSRSGGSTRYNVGQGILSQIALPFPSLPEQTKIAEFLTAIDKRIELLTAKKEKLSLYKKGVMQKIFNQEIRFKDENGEEFPDWEDKHIEDFCTVDTGNKDTKDRIENGDYPFFVRSDNVERIDSFSYDGEAILTSGDGVGVGKNFHYIKGKFNYHQRVYCLKNFREVNGKYVFYFFSESFYTRVMRLTAKNSVDSVRRDMITKMSIPVPTIKEQIKIANFLTSLDLDIQKVDQQITLNQTYKKGLLQQMFV